MTIVMTGVKEYAENMDVELQYVGGRYVIYAQNEAGYNCTMVDLIDVLLWVHKHLPTMIPQEESND
jgi:hypothetical protein